MALQPARVVSRLDELRALTGDENGAQRVAWTETWARGRAWLAESLADLPLEVERDAAGNDWYTLRGASERAVLIGGHMDSVPNGGWLDGCLNVLAGAEVLRRIAEEGTPPVTVRLVDWADEEGARFGRSLFGSSAAAGSMADQDELRKLVDRDGVALPDAIGRSTSTSTARSRRARSSTRPRPTSSSTSSRARCSSRSTCRSASSSARSASSARAITWTGQAAHAGSTPMDQRRDALAGAAKLALAIRDVARETGDGAVCTSGDVVCRPGIVTSVVETAEQLLDQRHLDAGKLAAMLARAQELAREFAAEERIDVAWERIWSIEPILFDETLVGLADEAIREVTETAYRLPSGPLHDAAEVSRAGVPTVMLFVQSLRGLCHTKLEDTKPEHLELSVAALDRLATKTIAHVAADA